MQIYNCLLLISIMMVCGTFGYASSHHPENFLKRIKGSPQEGQEIYKHFCAVCHDKNPQIKIGAPRVGELHDWQHRFKQGIQSLKQHTFEGVNAMPPRGGCFECSDQQLFLAIIEMIPNPLKKELLNELNDDKKINK